MIKSFQSIWNKHECCRMLNARLASILNTNVKCQLGFGWELSELTPHPWLQVKDVTLLLENMCGQLDKRWRECLGTRAKYSQKHLGGNPSNVYCPAVKVLLTKHDSLVGKNHQKSVRKPSWNFPVLHPKTRSFYFLSSFNHSFPISTAKHLGKVLVWNTPKGRMQVFSDLHIWAAQCAPVDMTKTRCVKLHLRNGSHELTHSNVCVTNTCEFLPRDRNRTGSLLMKLTAARRTALPGHSWTKDIVGLPLLFLWQVLTTMPNVFVVVVVCF